MTTLRQQIGQMLIMGFEGTQIDKDSPVANWLSHDGLGGVLLFDYDLANKRQGKNLVDQAQIKQLTQHLNYFSSQSFAKNGLPLFIAIDYEGGVVDRLQKIEGFITTIKPSELALLSDENRTKKVRQMATTLRELGFNLNFAPVVDLNLNSKQGIIGKLGRCFSDNPTEVNYLAKQFVQLFCEQGITCCYKHFPGHGSANSDSHYDFVDVSDSFQAQELEPYLHLLPQKEFATMVMTAHVINRQLDSEGLPATLSQAMLTGLLREKLGYEGVIVSDDLQMQAISNHFPLEDALRLSINAGADMLIFANQLGQISAVEVIDKIESLVNLQLIARTRIEQAYHRIMRLKQINLSPKTHKTPKIVS